MTGVIAIHKSGSIMTTRQQDLYFKAYWFAAEAHNGQLLPDTTLPYIVHPGMVCVEVMAALQAEKGHEADLAVPCALLHDVLEDTTVTYEVLRAEFGERVAEGVLALSKDKKLPKGEQMDDSLRRILLQPREVWMVKLADRINNLRTPPASWTAEKKAQYKEEARKILESLQDASLFLAERLKDKIAGYGTK
jgi:(p)ppGpp synthase/HD superfamily hydrolase